MLRLALVLGCLMLAACDDEMFNPPADPDLYKPPYDFAVPIDGGIGDLSRPKDFAGADLTSPPDLTTED
jgi:hypothetical protein